MDEAVMAFKSFFQVIVVFFVYHGILTIKGAYEGWGEKQKNVQATGTKRGQLVSQSPKLYSSWYNSPNWLFYSRNTMDAMLIWYVCAEATKTFRMISHPKVCRSHISPNPYKSQVQASWKFVWSAQLDLNSAWTEKALPDPKLSAGVFYGKKFSQFTFKG